MIVKICGITRSADALHAVAAGASALGFVFWPHSPRCIAPEAARRIIDALPPEVLKVGVFVNQTAPEIIAVAAASGIEIVQLHGDETAAEARGLGGQLRSGNRHPDDDPRGRTNPPNRHPPEVPVWRACSSALEAAAWPDDIMLLFDARDPIRRGGTGRAADWGAAAELAVRRPLVLAGGLDPANVARAIAVVRPVGVDVSSGVERAPGIKDPALVERFITAARAGAHAYQH